MVHRRVEIHIVFLQNHAALFFDFLRREFRIHEHVGQNCEGGVGVRSGDFHEIARVFFPGEGIKFAADRVDRLRNFARVFEFFAAFEKHVLEKMRKSVPLPRLVSTARAGEHERGDRRCPVDFFRHNF